jgi:hypothetical protein
MRPAMKSLSLPENKRFHFRVLCVALRQRLCGRPRFNISKSRIPQKNLATDFTDEKVFIRVIGAIRGSRCKFSAFCFSFAGLM